MDIREANMGHVINTGALYRQPLLNGHGEKVGLVHASPFGIPSKKKCPTEFLNFFWPKCGQVLGKHKSEVWGVGAF